MKFSYLILPQVKVQKYSCWNTLFSSGIEELHQSVRDGGEVGAKIQSNTDLNIGEWTLGSLTLIHVAVEADNLPAMEQLMLKVMF